MMEHYDKVSSRHREYQRLKEEELERGLDSVNGLKVKIHRNGDGVITGYESHHKFNM